MTFLFTAAKHLIGTLRPENHIAEKVYKCYEYNHELTFPHFSDIPVELQDHVYLLETDDSRAKGHIIDKLQLEWDYKVYTIWRNMLRDEYKHQSDDAFNFALMRAESDTEYKSRNHTEVECKIAQYFL